MAISLKHKFTSPKADGPDTTRIRPSNWNDEHDIIMETQRILGRITASAGPVEEIPLASTLEFSGGNLGVAAATVSRITALENQRVTGVKLGDTDFTHDLLLRAGSNLTASRTLTITTGDQDRSLDLTNPLGSYVYIGAITAASNANVDFQALPAIYDEFVILVERMWPSSGNTINLYSSIVNNIWINSATYSYSSITSASTNPVTAGATAVTTIPICTIADNSLKTINGEIRAIAGGNGRAKYYADLFKEDSVNGLQLTGGYSDIGGGNRLQGIRLTSPSGSLTGKFTLYGVRNSA